MFTNCMICIHTWYRSMNGKSAVHFPSEKLPALNVEPSSLTLVLTLALPGTFARLNSSLAHAERKIWNDILLCNWGPVINLLDTDTVLRGPLKGFRSLPTAVIPCVLSRCTLCNCLNKVGSFVCYFFFPGPKN